ncbi:4'-phosphopantetheinyl transferase superfamily protein [Flavobacterium hungaricum]|uniref:Phosphopantetheinyl transferase n=1 Tax=Flavobacterium hungaricum TaxID=2082725 RepID=A0ABR9TKT6_9FLAO|nr:4'-phosphopantetheinyl transferase superfamily protein [Flavobacterium hungaricum]MBE8725963.1 phosphopantetheinyl transferase [Flavobacterium hungaricum]
MIGNDVIDLAQSRIESRWQRRGFLEKLFTTPEQLLIKQSSEPEIMVWMLWSMKEAAYKIYNRQTKIRQYIPKKLDCTILIQENAQAKGLVSCGENIYYTNTIIDKDSIYTTAVCTLADLDHITAVENKNIFKDVNGIPYLYNAAANSYQDVSITHHGRFEKLAVIMK